MKLYHYTTFESFLKIWQTKTLKFAEARNMNDIFESEKEFSFHTINKDYINTFFSVLRTYKQISFVKDYNNALKGYMSTMMWGLYSDKGRGVCIEIDSEKLCLEGTLAHDIQYIDIFSMPNLGVVPNNCVCTNDFREYIESNAKLIFFTKSEDWQGENEFRIISHDHQTLDISNAISAIYITKWNSIECKIIEKLVGDEIPVKAFYIISTNKYRTIKTSDSTKRYRESRYGIFQEK